MRDVVYNAGASYVIVTYGFTSASGKGLVLISLVQLNFLVS